ncbi:SCO4225 family membrane protein [Streptomyces sp. NPDC001970]
MVLAGGYAAVIVGTTVWVEARHAAGFAGVWLIPVTLPSSVPLSYVPAPRSVPCNPSTSGGAPGCSC